MVEFYRALAQVSSTLLGLWLLVIGQRWEEWRDSPRHRLGARIVTVQLALPSLMSLVSLADPDGTALWRAGFAVLALVGAVALYLLRSEAGADPSWEDRLARWAGIAISVVVAVVALFAGDVAAATGVDARQLTAVLLSLLVFVSLNAAFSLLFRRDRTSPSRSPGGERQDARG